VLTLFVAGVSPRSDQARTDLVQMCGRFLDPGQYEIEIVDVLTSPDLAAADDVIAVPAAVSRHPAYRKVVGDFSDPERLAQALGIPTQSGPPTWARPPQNCV
jgi:circadian clock protein KaiB